MTSRHEDLPPRVLHIVPCLEFGGAPRGALELVKELRDRFGMKASLVALGRNAIEDDSEIITLHLDGLPFSAISLVKAVVKLRHIVRERHISLLHSHLLQADMVAALTAATLPAVGHLAHIRDTRDWLESPCLKDRFKKLLYRAAFAGAGTRFVAVASVAAEHARQSFDIHPKRLRVVLNGIDPSYIVSTPRHLPPLSSDRVTIGSAGRFVEEKGHAGLICALIKLTSDFPNIELRLAGQGGQRERLAQLGRSAGFAHFAILDNVRDMAAFYRDIDIFVLPSLGTEGLPRVMLEAMAAGCITVATDVSGVRDVIRDGENGRVVAPGDPLSLASVLRDLLTNRKVARAMAEVGRSDVLSRFTVTRVASDIFSVYSRYHEGTWETL